MGITFRWEDAIDDIADAEHYAGKIDNEIKKLKFFPYHCHNCSKKFMFQGELFDHEIEEHSVNSPYIVLSNIILGSYIFINDQEKLKYLIFKHCTEIKVQGLNFNKKFSTDTFKNNVSIFSNGDYTLSLLINGKSYKKYFLRIYIIPEDMLHSVNGNFINKFAKDTFTLLEIKDFEDQYKNLLIKKYVSGLCDYLRGILFRNNNKNNIENGTKWNELFNRSFSELQFHKNVLAESITNLIKLSLHDFNNFKITKTITVDYLSILLTELKKYGKSSYRSLPNLEKKIPTIPIDNSISYLLNFYENILEKKYIRELIFENDILSNERTVMKILFIWQNINFNYKSKDLDYLKKIISLNENNTDFKLFFEEVREIYGR